MISDDGNGILTYHMKRAGTAITFYGTVSLVSGTGHEYPPPTGTEVALDPAVPPSGPFDFLTTKTAKDGTFKFPAVNPTIKSEYLLIVNSEYIPEGLASKLIKVPQLQKAPVRVDKGFSHQSKRSGSRVDIWGVLNYSVLTSGKRAAWEFVFNHENVYLQRRAGASWKPVATLKAGYYEGSDDWSELHYKGSFSNKTTFRWVMKGSARYKPFTSNTFQL